MNKHAATEKSHNARLASARRRVYSAALLIAMRPPISDSRRKNKGDAVQLPFRDSETPARWDTRRGAQPGAAERPQLHSLQQHTDSHQPATQYLKPQRSIQIQPGIRDRDSIRADDPVSLLVPVDSSWLRSHPLLDSAESVADEPLEPLPSRRNFREIINRSPAASPESRPFSSTRDSLTSSSHFGNAVPPVACSPPPGFSALPPLTSATPVYSNSQSEITAAAIAAARKSSFPSHLPPASFSSSLSSLSSTAHPAVRSAQSATAQQLPASVPASMNGAPANPPNMNILSKGRIAKGPGHQPSFSSRVKYADMNTVVSSNQSADYVLSNVDVSLDNPRASNAKANAKRASEIDRLFASDLQSLVTLTNNKKLSTVASFQPTQSHDVTPSMTASLPSNHSQFDQDAFAALQTEANVNSFHVSGMTENCTSPTRQQIQSSSTLTSKGLPERISSAASEHVRDPTCSAASSNEDSLALWFSALGNNTASKEVPVLKRGTATADEDALLGDENLNVNDAAEVQTSCRASAINVQPGASQRESALTSYNNDLTPDVLSYFTTVRALAVAGSSVNKSNCRSDVKEPKTKNHILELNHSGQEQSGEDLFSPPGKRDIGFPSSALLASLQNPNAERKEPVEDAAVGAPKSEVLFTNVEEFFNMFKRSHQEA